MTTPLFIAVAWSRGKLHSPLRQFHLRRGEGEPLQLVGMGHQDTTFEHLWQGTQVAIRNCHPNTRKELFYASVRTAIEQSRVCDTGQLSFLLERLGECYYGSFFRCLRVFHFSSRSRHSRSYDVLPFFEHLEELYVNNLHFKPCPPTVDLALCHTLRVFHISYSPLAWIRARVFEQVVECRIAPRHPAHVDKLGRVEFPACTKMEFTGYKYLKIVRSFRLPSLDSLRLNLTKRPSSTEREIALLTRSVRPRVLEIRVEMAHKWNL
jgi:hypothetical protein